jgi:hypothetical protein
MTRRIMAAAALPRAQPNKKPPTVKGLVCLLDSSLLRT